MGLDELTLRVDQRLTLLGEDTLAAHAVDATLRADTLGAARAAHAGPLEVRAPAAPVPLPRISLAFPAEATERALEPGAAGPDLAVAGLLGEGGGGRVYSARQRALGRDVAVKVARVDAPPAVARAILDEGRLMGSLEHPNIVPVHALGCDDGDRPLLVMKRVEGVAWRELLRDAAHPAWARVASGRDERLAGHLEILQQVANALHFAHSRGVIHRDVKPENVMVGEFGEVYLLDWGIALRRAPDAQAPAFALVGTPAYMAPEMVIGDEVDARTDVYLLGATLHEVLTGGLRHQGADLRETLLAAAISDPVDYPDAVPAELAALARAATRAERDARPPSAAAFRDAIADYLAHRGSRALEASARRSFEAAAALLARGAAVEGGEVGALLAECRFGFEQALRAWPGNTAAREGLQACLERAVERELAQRNGAAARALIAALPAPRPDLEARVVELERELRLERERERQLDSSVGARSRMLTLLAFLCGAVPLTLAGWMRERATGAALTPGDLAARNTMLVVALLALVGFGRRRLLVNAYNRRIWALTTLLFVVGIALDGVSLRIGLSGPNAALLEVVAYGGCFAVAALSIAPRLWLAAGAMVALAVVLATMPRHMVLAGAVGLAFTLWLLLDDARRSAAR